MKLFRPLRPALGLSLLMVILFVLSASSQSINLRTLHDQAIVVDTHVDTVLRMRDRGVKLGVNSVGQVDIPKMRAGGLDVVFFRSGWIRLMATKPKRRPIS